MAKEIIVHFLYFFFFLLTSCIRELGEGEGLNTEPRVGMSVILAKDGRNAEGVVFKSEPALGQYPVSMFKDTLIYLYKDGVFFDVLQYDVTQNSFKGKKELESGKYYCQSIINKDTLSAYTTVPETTPFEKWQLTPIYNYDNEGYPYSQLKITIPNYTKELRYYHLQIFDYTKKDIPIDTTGLSIAQIEKQLELCTPSSIIEDPVLLKENIPTQYLFSNKLMEGKEYVLTANFYTTGGYTSFDGGAFLPNVESIFIVLRTVSPEYYEYTKSLAFYKAGRFPSLFDGASIYNIYNNVKPCGIVCAYSSFMIGPINNLYDITQK